jgi:hypothetical protein
MAPINQIALIQVRSGNQAELPGAPLSSLPLTFSPSLSTGELGFAVDTGRLFIGNAPNSGNAQFQRQTFPYQNVEVLTENSGPLLQGLLGSMISKTGNFGLIRAVLPPNSAWHDLLAQPIPGQDIGNPANSVRLTGSDIAAQVEYFAYNGTSTAPLRQGTMHIVSEPSAAQAIVFDSSISTTAAFNSAPPSPPAQPPASITFAFQFSRVVPSSGTAYFQFQYVNNLADSVVLYFNIKQPNPLIG